MGLHQELPVYKACYDLLLEIFLFTKDFSREFKFTVGESLKKETIELLTLIFRTNSRRDKESVLQEGHKKIEVIKLFKRLMKDMQQISLKGFDSTVPSAGRYICSSHFPKLYQKLQKNLPAHPTWT